MITPCIAFAKHFSPVKENSASEGYRIRIKQHIYGYISGLPDSNTINQMLADWLPNIYTTVEKEQIDAAISAALDESAIFLGTNNRIPLLSPVYF